MGSGRICSHTLCTTFANLILNCELLSRVLPLQLLFTGSDLLERALISSLSLLCFRNAVGLNERQNNLSGRNLDLSASSSFDSFPAAPSDRNIIFLPVKWVVMEIRSAAVPPCLPQPKCGSKTGFTLTDPKANPKNRKDPKNQGCRSLGQGR